MGKVEPRNVLRRRGCKIFMWHHKSVAEFLKFKMAAVYHEVDNIV